MNQPVFHVMSPMGWFSLLLNSIRFFVRSSQFFHKLRRRQFFAPKIRCRPRDLIAF